MSIVDSASANGLLSTPLVLPAPLAGALAALVLVMVVMLLRRSDSATVPRLLILVSVIAVCILVSTAILDRLEMSERTAEQRALLQREAQLSVSAITSGSLACLDGVAGEQVENACEQSVFADAQSTAKAVAYVSARPTLLRALAATVISCPPSPPDVALSRLIAMGSPLTSSLFAMAAPPSVVRPW